MGEDNSEDSFVMEDIACEVDQRLKFSSTPLQSFCYFCKLFFHTPYPESSSVCLHVVTMFALT